MELKTKDLNLLSYMYHNANKSISRIAKETNLTKDQVSYRLKRYISEGLITKFSTIFNYSSLGYNCFSLIFLKFEKSSSSDKFLQKLGKNKCCISYGKLLGKYDIYINAIFKDEKELGDYISNLVSDKENPIFDYLILKPYFAELYPLKIFNENINENITLIENRDKSLKVTKEEIEILKILEKDSTTPLVKIASKLKISPELAFYKLKKLKQEKIILGSRIQFNMKRLGYFFSVIFLNIPNLSEQNKNKLKTFVKRATNINTLSFSLAKPNCLIQIFFKEEKEFRETIEGIKELFKEEQMNLEIVHIFEEEKELNTLPFFN
ncbi:MAG: winged helix-turn-helix transcriptional regulator [Candidatus Nanoarchaeia archaeon]|nr:winged helix-turn-helix transcriptional regulator [Candidatus Nanoarchaeia archaeon]MDD5587939.1 winged helix-turn-helix transcriptional regulator [Candidatus Nanoarchaeia archaeon]